MSRIKWHETGERLYETGVRDGVLYTVNAQGLYTPGVAWNGLTGITESPSGAEPSPLWADDVKYLVLMSIEEFGATIEAYTYPDEFMECDGTAEIAPGVYAGQQVRKMFGLSYKTVLGNEIDFNNHGYKIHLVYGAMASPSDKAYQTINDSPEAITFSWELTTTPVELPGLKPTASITIDSTKVETAKLKELEDILYGTDGPEGEATVARLPLPSELITIIGADAMG